MSKSAGRERTARYQQDVHARRTAMPCSLPCCRYVDQQQRTVRTGMRDTTLPPVRVTAEFKARLARYAESQERDVSWVIRKVVEDYLARHGSEDDQR